MRLPKSCPTTPLLLLSGADVGELIENSAPWVGKLTFLCMLRKPNNTATCTFMEKTVLVQFLKRSRPVTVHGNKKELISRIKEDFHDLVNAEDELLLQRKDEEWGGEFVDIAEGEEVPDRSVIKVTVVDKVFPFN